MIGTFKVGLYSWLVCLKLVFLVTKSYCTISLIPNNNMKSVFTQRFIINCLTKVRLQLVFPTIFPDILLTYLMSFLVTAESCWGHRPPFYIIIRYILYSTKVLQLDVLLWFLVWNLLCTVTAVRLKKVINYNS